jgi:uncharacterized glyoxalase superfamily protein PhnB
MADSTVKLHNIKAVFLVDDIVKSAEYYRDVLGFCFNRYWGEPPCFCMLMRDEVEIFLSAPETPGEKTMRPNGSRGVWDAYIRVSDADALFAELRLKGANVVRKPETAFYQMREFEVEDINGYRLCFAHDTSEAPA